MSSLQFILEFLLSLTKGLLFKLLFKLKFQNLLLMIKLISVIIQVRMIETLSHIVLSSTSILLVRSSRSFFINLLVLAVYFIDDYNNHIRYLVYSAITVGGNPEEQRSVFDPVSSPDKRFIIWTLRLWKIQGVEDSTPTVSNTEGD